SSPGLNIMSNLNCGSPFSTPPYRKNQLVMMQDPCHRICHLNCRELLAQEDSWPLVERKEVPRLRLPAGHPAFGDEEERVKVRCREEFLKIVRSAGGGGSYRSRRRCIYM